MAKTKETKPQPLVTQGGANITAIMGQVVDLARQMKSQKAKRTEANEAMGLIRAQVEELGVPRKAFEAAVRYQEMDQDKRNGYDEGYALVRRALGLPFKDQLDLFAEDEDETETSEPGDGKSELAEKAGDSWPDDAAVIAARQSTQAAEQVAGDVILEDGVAKTTAKNKVAKGAKVH